MKAKKAAALALAAVMGTAVLTGCGANTVDSDAVVARMDDDQEVRLGLANFMARYTQSTYDSFYVTYFGEDYWQEDMSGEGSTMEDDVKEQIMDTLKTYYALEAHMEDYGVEITEEDTEAIENAAKQFIEDNDKDTLEAMSATEQDVAEYLRLLTIEQRMQEKIIADADTEVSDEEAAQRTFSYVEISTAGSINDDGETEAYSEEELAGLKDKAQALVDGGAEAFETGAEEAELTVETFSYTAGEEDEEMDEAVTTAADELKEGEMSGVIETEDAYYVIRLDSEFDQEATDAKKDEIIAERQEELYQQVCDEYTEDFVFEIDEDVWKTVSFEELFTLKETGEEESDDVEDETEDILEEEDTGDVIEDQEDTGDAAEDGDETEDVVESIEEETSELLEGGSSE